MNIQDLHQQLEELQQNDYLYLYTCNLDELTSTMMQHMGTIDAYTREMLIYPCFQYFIQHNLLDIAQLEVLLASCLNPDYLYFEISSSQTDGIFTRSYTLALLTLIIQYDTKHSFLTEKQLVDALEKILQYFKLEQDYRVIVPDKGYTRHMLHASSALHALIQNPNILTIHYEKVVHCLLNTAFHYQHLYYNNEDEYIITPIIAMLQHEFPQTQFLSILTKKIQRLPQMKERLTLTQFSILYGNIKIFLRTLFFRAKKDMSLTNTANQIEKILNQLPQYF
ncbi:MULTISPECIES: DUF2785 domain-containing protein [Bacillus]|uniref:DUF2785 domain-containing protein n=1 Tax=Bacillus TaxID=1386 RepID=UPI0024069AD3|nr:DUF2785 domain-containing protein [Bacillus cereus]MDF9623645.1 DUF2785 domain-containing protein [Bacillus cereus]HEF1866597.1 DUF2785 domain-containing protein [Bacillus cereus]